jgi:ubiquitin C-terminal hydrolase
MMMNNTKIKKIKGTSNISRCGLKNLGNTCYMNSSLQMFLGIDFLVDFLGTNQYKNAISDKEKYADMFLKSISKFCKQMG